jgi:general secretion pathway protein J
MSPSVTQRRITRVHAGFTLIELLVALMIFAILAVMAYGGLDLVLKARDRAEVEAERIADLQMALTLMERDIEQAINRPVRDDFGDPETAMRGTSSAIMFTRAGWRNPAGLPRSEMQRVGYALDGHDLRRVSYGTLDRAQGTDPHDTTVLGEVEEFDVRYMAQTGEWVPYWPLAATSGQTAVALPRAVEITLDTKQWGKITRLFRTAGAITTASSGTSSASGTSATSGATGASSTSSASGGT